MFTWTLVNGIVDATRDLQATVTALLAAAQQQQHAASGSANTPASKPRRDKGLPAASDSADIKAGAGEQAPFVSPAIEPDWLELLLQRWRWAIMLAQVRSWCKPRVVGCRVCLHLS